MSIKFRTDGSTFPTEVKNGELIIYIGSESLKVPFKFLVEDFECDNTEFPMCNVMCYLNNGNSIIVMRFDGTVTRFDKDMNVMGFCTFNKDLLYENLFMLRVGMVVHVRDGAIKYNTPCCIYSVAGSNSYILECICDPVHIEFKPGDNPLFVEDITSGTSVDPKLVQESAHVYREYTNGYIVNGRPVLTTGYKEM